MAIRDKMTTNMQPHLDEGETIQAIFGAQTVNQWWGVLTGFLLLLFVNQYMVVAVTDRRVLVGRSGRMTTTKVVEIERTFPRSTVIGPASGLWWKCESLGHRLFVHKRWHKDIEAADNVAGRLPA